MSDEYLTPEQAAEKLQLHPRTVRRLLTSGELPGARFGRQWRISAGALKAYVEGATKKPATSAGPAPEPRKSGTEGD